MQGDEAWEHISEAEGWTMQDCLGHRLSFKKKDDAKVIKEAMQQHIKRLRSLGWHLLLLKEK